MNRDGWMYFGIGLSLGAVIATLFAPATGAETRQMIAQKANDGMDQLKTQGQAWKGAATDAVGDAMQRTRETVQKAGKTMQHSRENLNAAVQGAKDAYREAVATTPGV